MAKIKDIYAQIGAMLTKKEDKPFSYEELATMLKTSPDALKTFEDAYKRQVLDSGALSEKVKHTAFDDFISIANDVNRLLYDIDPYEYRDNDGVESVDDIAVKLLYTAYRNTVIHKLQEYYDYYMENKEENPDFEHLAERCENITNRLAEYNKQN